MTTITRKRVFCARKRTYPNKETKQVDDIMWSFYLRNQRESMFEQHTDFKLAEIFIQLYDMYDNIFANLVGVNQDDLTGDLYGKTRDAIIELLVYKKGKILSAEKIIENAIRHLFPIRDAWNWYNQNVEVDNE